MHNMNQRDKSGFCHVHLIAATSNEAITEDIRALEKIAEIHRASSIQAIFRNDYSIHPSVTGYCDKEKIIQVTAFSTMRQTALLMYIDSQRNRWTNIAYLGKFDHNVLANMLHPYNLNSKSHILTD